MNDIEHQENSTALMDAGDSYELKQILSIAAAYLDSGQVADAEDLLQEAIEVAAGHPEVKAFALRVDHARGRSAACGISNPQPSEVKPDVLVNFTRPLPGVEHQTPVVQRLVRDAEGHYAAARLYAALDSAYLACAEAPAFLPGFVRLAEIQLALGKSQQADNLFNTLSYWHDVNDEPLGTLVQSLRISLDPSNTPALVEYAANLIDSGELSSLEPYVPEAISRSMANDPTAASGLSNGYMRLRPDNLDVQRLHLRVLIATGDADALAVAAHEIASPLSPLDVLVVRAIAEASTPTDEWLVWLGLVALKVRAEPSAHPPLQALIQSARGFISTERFGILSGVVAFSAGLMQECVDTLRFTPHTQDQPAVEEFVSLTTLAMALKQLNDPTAASVMIAAVRIAFQPDVETFASSTEMFGTGASPAELLHIITGCGGDAITEMHALRDANPERLELRSALASLYIESGKAHEAVRELRYVAQEHEKSGNLTAMVQAMSQISQTVPTNVEIKAKLIEGYLRRGVLDEAVAELDLIGSLYRERDRTAEAVAAFTRAAEIASAIGAYAQGNALFQKAVEADPDDVPVRHAAVAFYLQTGSIEEATEQLREVVRIVLLTDDRDEAVAALHQIIALAPHDPETYHKLGEVLTSLGEYTQAERVYRRLATFSPHDPVLEAKQSALAVLAAAR